jgi:hypothetical protein
VFLWHLVLDLARHLFGWTLFGGRFLLMLVVTVVASSVVAWLSWTLLEAPATAAPVADTPATARSADTVDSHPHSGDAMADLATWIARPYRRRPTPAPRPRPTSTPQGEHGTARQRTEQADRPGHGRDSQDDRDATGRALPQPLLQSRSGPATAPGPAPTNSTARRGGRR